MTIILNTYGSLLSRDNEGFVVCNNDGKQRIPVTGVRSIQIHKSAQITSDAVLLAIENEIEVLFMDRKGFPLGRVWSPQYGSISSIRKGQLVFSRSKAALTWIKKIIIKKIENQQALISLFCSDEAHKELSLSAIRRLSGYIDRINSLEGEFVSDAASSIRGWEGMSSKIYFNALNMALPQEFQFAERSQHPAKDPANALLNYGYGLLYNTIEGSLIKAGIDPYIGILHRDNYSRPVLVYDVIEQYRIWVDYIVYRLLRDNVIRDDYFSYEDNGAVWLESMGRKVLIQSFNDYMEDVVDQSGVKRSRGTQVQLFCQSLAQKFKSYE